MADFNDSTLLVQWTQDLLDKINHTDLFVNAAIRAEYRSDINIPGVPTVVGVYPMVIAQQPPQGVDQVEAMMIDTRTFMMFYNQIATPTYTYAMALEGAVSAITEMVSNWAHFRGMNLQYGKEIGYIPPASQGLGTHSGLIL